MMSGFDPGTALRLRVRNGLVAAMVVLAHAFGLCLVLEHSQVEIKLDSHPAGGSVQVRLVAALAAQPPAPPPVRPEPEVKAKAQEKPEATPPVEKPRKTPPVLSSRAPSNRAVDRPLPDPIKPAQPAPPPAPTTTAATMPSSPQPAAPAQAAPTPNLLEAPKQISAGELRQLGCQIPRPEYPAKARRLEQEGTVVVSLTIGADGAVSAARIAQSSGSPLLDEAALASIRAGHCQPYTTGGIARVVQATQPVAFNLND